MGSDDGRMASCAAQRMDHTACQSLQKAGFVELLDDGVVVLEGTLLNLNCRARG